MKKTDILLVEDNSTDADLTFRAIKERYSSLNVLHIEDGAEALDFIFSQGSYSDTKGLSLPKLILMDLQLPKINGQEVLQHIKQNATTKVVPIVILTSSNHEKDVMECYQAGANGYMVKPLDFNDYISQVSKAIEFWIDVNHLPNY